MHGTSARLKPAAPQTADILGVETVHVLCRIDCIDHALRVDMLRQRQLHQNAVDAVVGIEPGDQRQELGFADRRRQSFLKARNAGGGRRLALVADIDLARRVLADQHGAKPGCDARLGFQLGSGGRDIGNQAIRARFTVDPFRHQYLVLGACSGWHLVSGRMATC